MFALVVCAAILLARFGSLSHELTVPHVRCAEHGELMHLPISSAAVVTPGRMSGYPILQGQAGDAVDAHEHCGLAFALEGTATVPGPEVRGVHPPPPPFPAPVGPRLRSDRTAVLSAAPKTSPQQA